MRFGYYPGCALHGSSNDYEQSLRACLKRLDAELAELDEWICCGATAAHSLNHKLALALPARNLGLAESQSFGELLAPCPMCSGQLLKAQAEMERNPDLRAELAAIVETPIEGRTKVLNLIQVFQQVGIEKIEAAVTRKLESLKAACYYGCLLTRPPEVVRFDDPEQPQSMDAIVAALGAKPVAWNFKTECCGAGMTMADEETVIELSHRVLADAAAHGANCVVVACPMCHVNLDMKQSAIRERYGSPPLPVYYLSDLVGLAMGLTPQELGVDRHFVEAVPCPA